MDKPLPPIALVVAVAANGVMGRNGALPWHIPQDLAWFKQVTMGKAMVMGRKTWDSIGRPLPGRDSVVVSRSPHWAAEGAHVAHSVPDALALAARLRPQAPEIAVIGGAEIFAQTLPLAARLYWTEIHRDHDGDTVFPPFDRRPWHEVERHDQDGFSFLIMERQG